MWKMHGIESYGVDDFQLDLANAIQMSDFQLDLANAIQMSDFVYKLYVHAQKIHGVW